MKQVEVGKGGGERRSPIHERRLGWLAELMMAHLDGHVESRKSSPAIRPGGAVEAMAMRIIENTYVGKMTEFKRAHAWSPGEK